MAPSQTHAYLLLQLLELCRSGSDLRGRVGELGLFEAAQLFRDNRSRRAIVWSKGKALAQQGGGWSVVWYLGSAPLDIYSHCNLLGAHAWVATAAGVARGSRGCCTPKGEQASAHACWRSRRMCRHSAPPRFVPCESRRADGSAWAARDRIGREVSCRVSAALRGVVLGTPGAAC